MADTIIKITDGYFRTGNGRAYIKYDINKNVYRIYAANGDDKGCRKTFDEAVEKALTV